MSKPIFIEATDSNGERVLINIAAVSMVNPTQTGVGCHVWFITDKDDDALLNDDYDAFVRRIKIAVGQAVAE